MQRKPRRANRAQLSTVCPAMPNTFVVKGMFNLVDACLLSPFDTLVEAGIQSNNTLKYVFCKVGYSENTFILYINTVFCAVMLFTSFLVFSFVSIYQSKLMGGMPEAVCGTWYMRVVGVQP